MLVKSIDPFVISANSVSFISIYVYNHNNSYMLSMIIIE